MSIPTPLLFVCQGNICRSPFAEAVARARLGAEAHVFSRGLGAVDGGHAPRNAQLAARALGFDVSGHRGAQLMQSDVDGARTIVVMSPTQVESVEEGYDLAYGQRVVNLADFVTGPLRPGSIPDPFRGPEWAYAACFQMILAGVQGLLGEG